MGHLGLLLHRCVHADRRSGETPMVAHRLGSVVAAFLVASLALAGAASASELRLDTASDGSKTLVFTASAGEINHVNIDLQGSNYTIQDLGGAPITPVSPCTTWDVSPGTAAICPARDVTAIDADLGDQSDWVFLGAVSMVLVPVDIRGDPGNDSLSGGDGPDTIDAYDGSPDVVDCRGGQDTVYADPIDSIKNCEAVIS